MNASALGFRVSALALTAVLAACAGSAPPAQTLGLADVPEGASEASVYGLYLAGEAAIDRGSSEDAAFYFSKASALDPTSAPILSRAFTAALVAGDIKNAARLASGLSDGQAPVNGLARVARAAEDLAEDRGREALAVLPTGAEAPPHTAAAALLRPWAALQAGDLAQAELLPDAGANPLLKSIAALSSAEILEREGKVLQAEAVYKAHPDAKNGLFVLGYGGFLERRGRFAEAAALYARSLASKPDDAGLEAARDRAAAHGQAPAAPTVKQGAAEALLGPAVLMLAQHQGDMGLGYLRLALRLDPHLDEGWVLVGDQLTAAGDQEGARQAYGHVSPGSGQFDVARGDLALALQKSGDKEGALALVRQTLAANPKDARLLSLYADLLSEDDRYADAATALTDAIQAVGEKNAGWTLFYLRGASEERAGRWADAEADLKRALALDPEEPEIMNYLGYAWVDRDEHIPEALSLLEKAEAKQPDSGAIVDSLGWARYRTHDYADALLDLERAVQLDPADPEVNSHLGDVYWRVGRRLEARYQWRRVLTLAPDAKIRTSVEEKLKDGLPEDADGAVAPAPTAPSASKTLVRAAAGAS